MRFFTLTCPSCACRPFSSVQSRVHTDRAIYIYISDPIAISLQSCTVTCTLAEHTSQAKSVGQVPRLCFKPSLACGGLNCLVLKGIGTSSLKEWQFAQQHPRCLMQQNCRSGLLSTHPHRAYPSGQNRQRNGDISTQDPHIPKLDPSTVRGTVLSPSPVLPNALCPPQTRPSPS